MREKSLATHWHSYLVLLVVPLLTSSRGLWVSQPTLNKQEDRYILILTYLIKEGSFSLKESLFNLSLRRPVSFYPTSQEASKE